MASQPPTPSQELAEAADRSSPQYTRGHWRPTEDDKLKQLVAHHGPQNWNLIAQHLEGRSGKSCRLRWFNQLDPRINRAAFSAEEEQRLVAAHRLYGNKWACIARLFPGRTDNAVKNHWHVIMARHSRQAQQHQEQDFNGPLAKRSLPFVLSPQSCVMQRPPPRASHVQPSPVQQSGEEKNFDKQREQSRFPLLCSRLQEGGFVHGARLTMEKIDQTCKSWHICDDNKLEKSASSSMYHHQRELQLTSANENLISRNTQTLIKEVPFIDFLGVGRV